MKKFLIITFIIFTTMQTLSAQDTVYFRNTSSGRNIKKHPSAEQNIVKIAPLNFIGGTIPVYFEREINQFLGLQISGGVTTRNYLKDVFANSEWSKPDVGETKWNDGTTDTYTNINTYYGYEHRKAYPGYIFSVEPRIFYENEGIDGNFIGLSFTRSRFNTAADKIATGQNNTGDYVFTTSTFSEHENISDIMVNFGSQTLYDHISLEYSTGIGLRKLDGVKYAYGTDNSGNYIDGYSNILKTKIAFNLSFKIGYHF